MASQLGYTRESLPQPDSPTTVRFLGVLPMVPRAGKMLWHLLKTMVAAEKKKKENLKQPLPTSNTALWNESALFLERVCFFSVIHSLSGRTSHLCERTFMCRVQHLGPF